jgi:hypothetical protein
MTREHVTQCTVVCLIMALAIWEAGPHEPGAWRLSAILGAQQNPPVMALVKRGLLRSNECNPVLLLLGPNRRKWAGTSRSMPGSVCPLVYKG